MRGVAELIIRAAPWIWTAEAIFGLIVCLQLRRVLSRASGRAESKATRRLLRDLREVTTAVVVKFVLLLSVGVAALFARVAGDPLTPAWRAYTTVVLLLTPAVLIFALYRMTRAWVGR